MQYINVLEGPREKRPVDVIWSEEGLAYANRNGINTSKLIKVDELPEPASNPGEAPLMYYNEITNEVFYDYVPIPLTSEQKIEQLEVQLAAAEEAKLTTLEAVAELYEMMNGAK
ncbi:hypothetical protein [Paenibacillus paeoniae]|uniref:Uncharacterized protein n=1 Tax=Paenibacillus paeoniae TaxID=2292705 RepID=A0A371PEP1_9BACL|nr:hypothetical protein [Paenibacillus paeoniae]REK74394.1 hypothetical protein DX130_17910 [Paenibacillus paeoniae]